jgi:NitT/TauT family transport system ATP-binding protein
MVVVTHSVVEAVFFATKIVVLAAHPGRVDVELPVTLPYPRDPEAPEFRAIVAKLHAILTRTHLPDGPVDRTKVSTRIDEKRRQIAPVSIPYVTPGEVLGLLSLVGDEGCDLFALAERLAKEFAAVVPVVKAAELLGLVETPGQEVFLTTLGLQIINAGTNEQRRLIRERLLTLKIFELLTRLIRVQPEQVLAEEELLRELQVSLPHERTRPLFRTLLSWGRYSELISYDQRTRLIRLHEQPGTRGDASPAPIPG